MTLPVVVPVKRLELAKQRLGGVLDAAARQALYRCMLEDVLDALAAARLPAEVVIVSADAEVRALAERRGARLLEDTEQAGQSAAIALAARALAAEGRDGMLTIPGDVPLCRAADIDAVLAAHDGAPAVTLVPARDDFGSNALACSPPDAIAFHFGDDSFRRHLAAARAIGIEPRVLRLPRLALDIDRPEDLALLARRAHAGRTGAWLEAHRAVIGH